MGTKLLEIRLDRNKVWKHCLEVYGATILSKDRVTWHSMVNGAAGKDFVTHARHFAFGGWGGGGVCAKNALDWMLGAVSSTHL